MPPDTGLALLLRQQYVAANELRGEVLAAFDEGGIDAVAELAYSDTTATSWLFATDSDGVIVLHPDPALIGESIVGELGSDMYGYPWHDRFFAASGNGSGRHWALMLARDGHRNAISGTPSGIGADANPFDDWRADTLNYEGVGVIPVGNYRIGLVHEPGSVIQIQELLMRFSLRQLNEDPSIRRAADLVTRYPAYGALADAGRWMSVNTGGGRVVGFVADTNGIIVDSTFDPTVNGLAAADLLGPDALAQATEQGIRYRDPSRGVDVVMIRIPNGWVLVGGITGP